MATTGTGAAGAPRDIGTVYANGPTYLGTDGQSHQYTGKDASGVYTYDPAYPPAAGGAPSGGAGLVESLQPLIGKLELGTAILAGAAAVVLVGLEVVTVGTAVFWLLGLLALDAGVGVLSSAAEDIEHWAGGDPNEPGINPLTKLVRMVSKALGLGGLMGDFILTAAICGTVYFISHRQGQTRIQFFRPPRTNPPGRSKRRRIRRVSPAVKLLK